MLAKKYHLNRAQIQAVYKRGTNRGFGDFGTKSIINSLEHPRIAVVIPKAVVKLAVDRNRFRRVIFDEISSVKCGNSDMIIRLFKAPTDEKLLRIRIHDIFK